MRLHNIRPLLFSVVVLSLLSIFSFAAEEMGGGTEENATWIDRAHFYLSDKLLDLSKSIDTTLANALGGEGDGKEAKRRKERIERERSDAFFQTRRYLNETTLTYIRLRGSATVRSVEDEDRSFSVRAHVPLSRVRKRLRLFLEDLNDQNAEYLVKKEELAQQDTAGRTMDKSPKFGLNYFAPRAFGIHAKYSLGFSSLHPYVRARYSRLYQADGWMIEPVETLQYSEKYDFSEQTDLYIDKEVAPDTLLRIQFDRGTQAHQDGMYYGAGVGCYWTLSHRSGMRLVQTFRGDTGYEYTPEGETESRRFKGIYHYTTAFGYRRSVWRPWLFVEFIPAVSYDKSRDYRPGYSATVLLDLFVGNY